MTPDDIAPEFRAQPKDYAKPAPIDGVRILRLTRFTDDRGFFLELFRSNPQLLSDHTLTQGRGTNLP